MNPFHTIFSAIASRTINKMSPDKLLAVMDAIGRQFIDTDENLAHFDPDQPAGMALMRVWGNSLPPQPSPDSPEDILQAWWNQWWEEVFDSFAARYGAIAGMPTEKEVFILHPPSTELNIVPVPAPRQSGRDAWKPRPCVIRYREYRDAVIGAWGDRELCLPCKIIFILPMPKSWSEKKKKEKEGEPHLSKPDDDNLLKAFIDSLYRDQDDSHVWSVWAEKRWGKEGKIIIQNIEAQGKING